MSGTAKAALVWDDRLAGYLLRPGHPLNPRRLQLTISLLRAAGLAPDGLIDTARAHARDTSTTAATGAAATTTGLGRSEDAAEPSDTGETQPREPGPAASKCRLVRPRTAEDAELLRVHTPAYLDIVKRLSEPGADADAGLPFGLGTEDNPIMERMHETAALVCGATLTAAELVMSGVARRAFNPAGGMHHAKAAEASGFCVYNDLAVAIRWIQQEHGARVMYIDYDAHHGDGVQEIFYNDPEVLTVSFHESGLYLFPASGFIDELGAGDGYGYSVNMPLEPGTEDGSWRDAFTDLVPALADAFRPDVIVLQNGCDGHVLDPLAHLRATTGLFEEFVKLVCQVADHHCEGRVIATGGGGYAIHEVVPRAWTLAWAALAGLDAPDPIPAAWLDDVRDECGFDVPSTLRDPPGAFPPPPGRKTIESRNDLTRRAVRARVLPLLTGWGLGF